MKNFNLARIPPIFFGAGKLDELPDQICVFGKRVLLVTGSGSLRKSGIFDRLVDRLKYSGISHDHVSISEEPCSETIDEICSAFRKSAVQVVVGIGGGSVIDGAKAISAMLPHSHSVADHLEGLENSRPYSGVKVPFIALPTTAGTGAEMTKNAVIITSGKNRQKRSLRHHSLIPDIVLVDPELALSCPPDITAACGMDAFTQLLESYLSTAANPITDALTFSGIETFLPSIVPACRDRKQDVAVRGNLAYSSLLSGITLANAGLGIVHGLAGFMGGFFNIPHGVVCGTLVWSANKINIRALRERQPDSPFLLKYAEIGKAVHPDGDKTTDFLCDAFLDRLERLNKELVLPRLGNYGVREEHLDSIVQAAKNRNNPIALEKDEIYEIVSMRL
jgi:alcohol dehydrogenase